MRKEQISVQNVGPQARLAVLQIAMQHTALFMTVLTLDILNPRSVAERKSVMQLVAFLIRKVGWAGHCCVLADVMSQRPLILYPHLPRLMEAVVKSLDPNSTASRDAVLDTATEIIGHVVRTYVLSPSSPYTHTNLHPARQLPNRRLSQPIPTSRRWHCRRRLHHVRPQICHPALRPRGTHPPPDCVCLFARRPTAGNGVARGGGGEGVESGCKLGERVVTPRAAAEAGRYGVTVVQDVSVQRRGRRCVPIRGWLNLYF